MKDIGLKLCCAVIGYNYDILKQCTEASVKTVKKYVSALLVIGIIWFLIGYTFYQRYLHGDSGTSILAGSIMVFIIIMIERQIILTVGKHGWASVFRFFIGVIMAIIGSVIIDQTMFKDDIEKNKIEQTLKRVEELLPNRTKEIDRQIADFESLITLKEKERSEIINELTQKPAISLPTYQKSVTTDTSGKLSERVDRGLTTILNPKSSMIERIDTLLKRTRDQKNEAENKRANLRKELEEEIKEQKGFLDELLILKDIISSSLITVIVYLLFFLFLTFIELLILIIKLADEENDYDLTIMHQMKSRKEMLKQLSENKSLQTDRTL